MASEFQPTSFGHVTVRQRKSFIPSITEATQRGIDCAPEMGQLAERSQEHVVAVANNSMQREWSPPPGWTAALRIWPSPSCGGEYGPSSPIQAEL
jgi:hypothetical protein